MKLHRFHRDADAEYAEAARHYAELNLELGERFYDQIERLIIAVRAHPARYRLFEPPARRLLAENFPYAVVYLDEPEHVWIVAVMHLHREPGYWKGRLESRSPSRS